MAELCPKCGDDDISTRYQPVGAGRGLYDYKQYTQDCLKKTCRRCGYKWDEPCKDAISQEAPSSFVETKEDK